MTEITQGFSRRDFLRLAGGAAVFTGVGAWGGTALAQAPAGQGGRRIPSSRLGVQLWTVRNQASADLEGTLAAIAAIGYREVEPYDYYGYSAEEWRTLLQRYGLSAPSIHRGVHIFQDEELLRQELEAARTLGVRYFVLPFVGNEWRNEEGYRELAEILNRAGEIAREYGIKVGYHNHDFEFEDLNGTTGFEILVENTDPRLVHIQLDIGWTYRAGEDPVAWMLRYPGRFETVHVKDWDGSRWVNVGEGEIDWEYVFSHAHIAGIRHYIVENDDATFATDPFAEIAESYEYITQELRFRPAPGGRAQAAGRGQAGGPPAHAGPGGRP